MTDTAVLHEKLLFHGGAQHVAYNLARVLGAPIFTGWHSDSETPDDIIINQLFSNRSKLMLKMPTVLTDFYHMLEWQYQPEISEYDTVIINKTNCGWYVPKENQQVIWYLHSTPRTIYDLWYNHNPGYFKRLMATFQRTLYQHPLNYADKIICNSDITAQRLEKYMGKKADAVIYPPVDVNSFYQNDKTRDFYLSVSRLDDNKEIEEIISVFNEIDKPLKIAGDGPKFKELDRMAGDNIEMLGFVSESEKHKLMSQAKAFIMNARNEDFGLTPIEANAAGTPVLGVNEGFTKHQINDYQNGLLYERGYLKVAIDIFEGHYDEFDSIECQASAEKYDISRFAEEIQEVINA